MLRVGSPCCSCLVRYNLECNLTKVVETKRYRNNEMWCEFYILMWGVGYSCGIELMKERCQHQGPDLSYTDSSNTNPKDDKGDVRWSLRRWTEEDGRVQVMMDNWLENFVTCIIWKDIVSSEECSFLSCFWMCCCYQNGSSSEVILNRNFTLTNLDNLWRISHSS